MDDGRIKSGIGIGFALLLLTLSAFLGACTEEDFTRAGGQGSGVGHSGTGKDGGGTGSGLTSGQENAVRSAESHLSMSGFSRSGLIEQLEFEGYKTKDATFAVDYLNVDWKKQAVRSAESYLSMSGFSRSGLIEQLEFDGYSREEAEYGADKAL